MVCTPSGYAILPVCKSQGGNQCPPALDHLLEALWQVAGTCCEVCLVGEERLPVSGGHAGNEDQAEQSHEKDGALQSTQASAQCQTCNHFSRMLTALSWMRAQAQPPNKRQHKDAVHL